MANQTIKRIIIMDWTNKNTTIVIH